MGHIASYLWKIRQHLGSQLVLLPGQVLVLGEQEGHALFQRRADNGVWELPAGGCGPGQSFRTAAVTELFEETGIVAKEEDLVDPPSPTHIPTLEVLKLYARFQKTGVFQAN